MANNDDEFLDLAAISGDSTADDGPGDGGRTAASEAIPADVAQGVDVASGGTGAAPPTQTDLAPGLRALATILSLLTLGGGAAGVAQNLFGRPPTTTVTPRLSPLQTGLLGGAQGQFGQSNSLLQALLGQIQNPSISPALSALVEQSFQPALGDLFARATEQGRLRGFRDAPATSPPGGAIFGPGLAALQGQMAAAKLGLFQNQVGNLTRALQGSNQLANIQGTLAGSLPTQQRTQAPPPTILQTLGSLLPVVKTASGFLGFPGLLAQDQQKQTAPTTGSLSDPLGTG